MRLVTRIALCALAILAVSALSALAWDRSEQAAAQSVERLDPQ
jgi:hypothetical protein